MVHHLEHARRQAGLLEQFDQAVGGERHLLARLEHEGVAAGDRDRIHPHRHQCGEIVGANADAHADRLAHHAAVDAARHVLEDLAFEHVGDTAGILGHLDAAAQIAARLGHGLAVFLDDQGGDLLEVLFKQNAVTHHDAHALHRRRLPPVVEGVGGGLYGAIDHVGAAHRHLGDDRAGGGVVDRGGRHAVRRGPGSVD